MNASASILTAAAALTLAAWLILKLDRRYGKLPRRLHNTTITLPAVAVVTTLLLSGVHAVNDQHLSRMLEAARARQMALCVSEVPTAGPDTATHELFCVCYVAAMMRVAESDFVRSKAFSGETLKAVLADPDTQAWLARRTVESVRACYATMRRSVPI